MYLNLTLRILSVAFKFLLMVAAPKYMPGSDYIALAVLLTAVALTISLCGLEFHTYSSKQILNLNSLSLKNIILNSSLLYVISYFTVVPILIYIYGGYVGGGWEVLLLGLIFILEHATTEISRVLVFVQKQLRASIVLMLKSGLWSIFVLLYLVSPFQYSLRTILLLWIFCLLLSLLGGFLFLEIRDLRTGWGRVSPAWIRRGLPPALKMLAYSASIHAIFSFDKIFVDKYAAVEFGVAYVFFFSFCSFTLTILDATVISYYLPKLIRLHAANTNYAFEDEARKFNRLILKISLVSICVVSAMSLIAIKIMGYSNYLSYIYLLPILAASFFIYNMGTYAQMMLYIDNKESVLALLNVSVLLIYITAVFFGVTLLGEAVIPLVLLLSFGVLYLGRTYFLWKYSHRQLAEK